MDMPGYVYGEHTDATVDALAEQAQRLADDLYAIAKLMRELKTGPLEFPKQAELHRSVTALESFASSARKEVISWKSKNHKFGKQIKSRARKSKAQQSNDS